MTIRSKLGASARGTPRVPPPAAAGSQGAQGARGAQGFQGSTGAQGVQGVIGAQGFQGAQGSQGFQGATGTQVVADLAALELVPNSPNGATVYVLDQAESYRLDTANTFVVSSPLIVAALGGGRWFRRSKEYVVGNFTLWCTSFGFGVVGFTPGQLAVSSGALPDIQLDAHVLFGTDDLRIITDSLGNLWVVARNTGFTVIKAYKFLLKDCLASGAIVPSVTLSVPVPASSEALMAFFDKLNGLWVGNGTHGASGVTSLVRYGQRDYQLSLGTPSTTLVAGSIAPLTTSNQQDGVLDGQGNLWCTIGFSGDAGGVNGGVVMFSASQLAAGGAAVAPVVVWSGSNFGAGAGGVGHTSGAAISPAGLLWVASLRSNTLKAWDIRSPSSGNPAPVVTITCSDFSNSLSIAFDASGNLWVCGVFSTKLIRIPAASLLASGAVSADVILSQTTFVLEETVTFPNNPDRAGLLPSGIPA